MVVLRSGISHQALSLLAGFIEELKSWLVTACSVRFLAVVAGFVHSHLHDQTCVKRRSIDLLTSCLSQVPPLSLYLQ